MDRYGIPITDCHHSGSTWDDALDLSVAFSIKFGGAPILLPPMEMLFSRMHVFEKAITLIGSGTATSGSYGTTIMTFNADLPADDAFLRWNGNEGSRGVGGGMRNITLRRGTGKGGGIAIDQTSIVDTGGNGTFRPGFMLFDNVVIVDITGAGIWDVGMRVNGAGFIAASTGGVRDVCVRDCYFCAAKIPLFLNNAYHFYMNGGQVFQGTSSNASLGATGIVKIVDGSDIGLNNVAIYGQLLIQGSAVDVRFSGGMIQAPATTPITPPYVVDPTCKGGMLTGSINKKGQGVYW